MTVTWDWKPPESNTSVGEDTLRKLKRRFEALLDEQSDEDLHFLQELLRARSVSGSVEAKDVQRYNEGIARCLELLQDEAKTLGFQYRSHRDVAAVVEWPGRNGLHAEGVHRPGLQHHPHHRATAVVKDADIIGVATHLDVVPVDEHWDVDPFAGEVIDGEVWGRGAQDDKGPIAAVFAALKLLRRLGLDPDKDIRLIFGTLEETSDWPDMDLLLEEEATPDIVLVPDGAFPVVLGEKGIMTMQWRGEWDDVPEDAWVPEALTTNLKHTTGRNRLEGPEPGGTDRVTAPYFVGAHAGERPNVVPADATLWFACRHGDSDTTRQILEALPDVEAVEDEEDPPAFVEGAPCFRVTFDGESAHGAFPQLGDNAAIKALRALEVLYSKDTGIGSWARFLLRACFDPTGAGIGIDHEHERMGASTLNLGVLNCGPTHGHADVNMRFPIPLKAKDIEERFEGAASRAESRTLRIRARIVSRPQDPFLVEPDEHPQLVKMLQDAYAVGTGRTPSLATIAGTSYAKVFPLAIGLGPQDLSSGEEILAHKPNERVSLERQRENVLVYALALAQLAFDAEDLERAATGDGSTPPKKDKQ